MVNVSLLRLLILLFVLLQLARGLNPQIRLGFQQQPQLFGSSTTTSKVLISSSRTLSRHVRSSSTMPTPSRSLASRLGTLKNLPRPNVGRTLGKNSLWVERRYIDLTPVIPIAALATVVVTTAAEQTLSPSIPTSSVAAAATIARPSALGSFQFMPSAAEMELMFRLAFASLTGSLIGLERSRTDRRAGIRTMALVSRGAASFTLC